MESNYEQRAKALRYCANARNCEKCTYRISINSFKCRIQHAEDAADAIEALLKKEALLKENIKGLIEDRPELVEADGHWEWRKPNGEVLMPKRGEWVRVEDGESYHYECSRCGERPLYSRYGDVVLSGVCPMCGAKMTGEEDEVHSGI